MRSWRASPSPLSSRPVASTTSVRLLVTLTSIAPRSPPSPGATVKPMPTVASGSVGSPTTPLAAPLPLTARSRWIDVVAASTVSTGAPGVPTQGSYVRTTRALVPGLARSRPSERRESSASSSVEATQPRIVSAPSAEAGAQALTFCVRNEPGNVWSP